MIDWVAYLFLLLLYSPLPYLFFDFFTQLTNSRTRRTLLLGKERDRN